MCVALCSFFCHSPAPLVGLTDTISVHKTSALDRAGFVRRFVSEGLLLVVPSGGEKGFFPLRHTKKGSGTHGENLHALIDATGKAGHTIKWL